MAKLPGGALAARVGPSLPASFLMSRGVPKPAVGQNGQHRDRAAEIVGHQAETAQWMDAHIGRPSPAGADRVEQRQISRPPDRWRRR